MYAIRRNVCLIVALSLCLSCAPRQEKEPGSDQAENPAAQATPLEEDDWKARHQSIVDALDRDPELILVGNSIFHSLDNADREVVWQKYLDSYRTVNMGISGDRTENVIWRLLNGSLEGIDPKVAVLLIGTNNTDGNHYLTVSTPEELAGGIWRICTIIREKLPETRILIMGILPYGYKPNHRDELNKATNRFISRFPDRDPLISYADIGSAFVDASGKVKKELMPDYLHPNAGGHLLMFDLLQEDISRLMDE